MTGPTLGTTSPRVHLYDVAGTSWVGDFAKPQQIRWQDILSHGASTASFAIPLTDPLLASVDSRMVVKFSLHGAIRFGCAIMSEKTQLAVDGDGNRLVVFEGQPGLFAMLNDAVIYPEYGLKVRSGQDRFAGFMSADGSWRVTADWADCLGDPRNGGIRDYPPDLVADNPDFISVDPTAPVSTFAEYYFRNKVNTFIPAADGNYEFVGDFDNFGDFYVNGELLLSSDRTDFGSYRVAQKAQKFLQGGVAVQFAAYVQNDFELVGSTPLAFAMVVYSTDTSGNRTGTVFKTQAADWIVNDGSNKPGWHRGQVVYSLLAEAQARGVNMANALTPTFSMTVDSNGNAWADTPDTFSFPVGTQGLADTITQLCDKADCWVDAATMEIHMYNRKGGDLSGTVEFKLGPDSGGLLSYETTKTSARRTVMLAQMASGLYVETVDSAGVTAVGRVESGMAAGSTNDRGTAVRLSQVQLRSTAADQYTVTAEAATAGGGPDIYVDCDLGDTILSPAHRNAGTMKARGMSVTVDATGEVVRKWYDTLVKDGSV